MLLLLLGLLATPPPDTAEAVALGVVTGHPELEAAEAQADALEALVDGARVRPDPMVGVEYSNVPLTQPWLGEHPMSGVQLKVSQTLLAPGKVDARQAAAREQADAARAAIPPVRNRLAGGAAEAWYGLARIRQLRTVTREHIELLGQLIDVVTVSYEVGRAAQHELLQLETLRDRLTDDLGDFERGERMHLARLNAALRRPTDAALPTPERTPLPPPPDRGALVKAVGGHPALTALEAAAAAAERVAGRAEHEKDPDITLSAGYRVRREVPMKDEGEDFVSLGVSMPLPWFWNEERWDTMAAAQRAAARAARARARAERDRLTGDVGAAVAEQERALRKVTTYEGELVKTAHRALDATLAAYRVGRAGFSQLYQAEVALLDLERGAIVARADAAIAATRLKTLTGAWVEAAATEAR